MHADVLTTAREAYGRRAWTRAHELLSSIDEAAPLAPEDLERLAVCSYMLGLDDQQLAALARAHDAHRREGDRRGAVRAAFWLMVHLMIRGELGRATGWHGRARRLVEPDAGDCVERGYLAGADALRCKMAGDRPAPGTRRPRRRQRRRALRRAGPGRARAQRPRPGADRGGRRRRGARQARRGDARGGRRGAVARRDGVRLLRRDRGLPRDVRAGAGPGVDRRADRVVRAAAGPRPVHRHLPAAPRRDPADPRRVGRGPGRGAAGAAALRGSGGTAARRARRPTGAARSCACGGTCAGAERAFRDASRHGREPQPGLALLRLAEGRTEAASATIAGVLDAASGWMARAGSSPPSSRSPSPRGTSTRRVPPATELGRDRGAGNGRTMLLASAAQARGGGRARRRRRPRRGRAAAHVVAAVAPARGALRGGPGAPAGRRGVPVDGRRRDRRRWSERRRATSWRAWARGPAGRRAARSRTG